MINKMWAQNHKARYGWNRPAVTKTFIVVLPLTPDEMESIHKKLLEDSDSQWELINIERDVVCVDIDDEEDDDAYAEEERWQLEFCRYESAEERNDRLKQEANTHIERVREAHRMLLDSKTWLEENGFASEYATALVKGAK